MSSESCWPPLKGAGYKGACGAVTSPGLGLKTGWSCNQGPCEAVSTSILPLNSSWHLDLPFAGRDIPSLLCSESLETFFKKRKPSDGSETPGVLSMIPFLQEESAGSGTSCSVSSARSGQRVLGWILQITATLNTSHDISTKEQFRCSFHHSFSSSMCI